MEYHRLRVPRQHGAALVEPSLAQAAALALAAGERLNASTVPLAHTSLGELRAAARHELQSLAARHAQNQRAWLGLPEGAVPRLAGSGPIVLAGHQPDLVHAGVWFKNFVLDALARTCAGSGYAIIIDNDLLRAPGIRVPGGSLAEPRLEFVSYDDALEPQPWEDRTLQNAAWLGSFGGRVAQVVQPFVAQSLFAARWPALVQVASQAPSLGAAFACLRQGLEWEWGLQCLDVPLGALCETMSFRALVLDVFRRLPDFQAAYNFALGEYRAVHGLRNPAQPLPNLTVAEGWLESPLWVWQRQAPRRQSLWVRPSTVGFELSNRAGWSATVKMATRDDWLGAFAQLAELSAKGVRLRPRALLTTLFARLLLGDFFLHGIGGSKYDQVTDAIIERHFGLAAPPRGVATATLQLPCPAGDAAGPDAHEMFKKLREMRFHPEIFLPPSRHNEPALAAALRSKQEWLAVSPPRGARGERHRALMAANQVLAGALAWERQQCETLAREAAAQQARLALLASREFAWGIFPEEFLRGALLDIRAKLA